MHTIGKIGPLSFSIWADRLETRAQGISYTTVLESSGKSPGSATPVSGWVTDRDPKGKKRYILGGSGVTDIANTTGKIKLAYDLTSESQVRLTLGFWDSTGTQQSPNLSSGRQRGSRIFR